MSIQVEPIHWAPGVTLDDVERQVILKAFAFFNRNKTQTSRALNIAIRTLDVKLEKYAAQDAAEIERQKDELERRKDFLKRQRGSVAYTAAVGVNPDGFADVGKAHGITTEGNLANVQSAFEAPAQSDVSVSERSKVQGVLPRQAPKVSPGKAR